MALSIRLRDRVRAVDIHFSIVIFLRIELKTNTKIIFLFSCYHFFVSQSCSKSGTPAILTLNDDFARGLVSVRLAGVEASVGHLDALEDQLPLPAVLHDLGAEGEGDISLELGLRGRVGARASHLPRKRLRLHLREWCDIAKQQYVFKPQSLQNRVGNIIQKIMVNYNENLQTISSHMKVRAQVLFFFFFFFWKLLSMCHIHHSCWCEAQAAVHTSWLPFLLELETKSSQWRAKGSVTQGKSIT